MYIEAAMCGDLHQGAGCRAASISFCKHLVRARSFVMYDVLLVYSLYISIASSLVCRNVE